MSRQPPWQVPGRHGNVAPALLLALPVFVSNAGVVLLFQRQGHSDLVVAASGLTAAEKRRCCSGAARGDDPDWFRVMDTDHRIYAARYSAADPTLAPPGHQLIQIAAACSPRERKADAEFRVGQLLDQAWPGWRDAVRWRRGSVRTHCTGAIDLPGTTWRDRPAISRGDGLAVATDQSAAPGLLGEVAIAAARLAVEQLNGFPAISDQPGM